MERNALLKADYLDIIFDNRNKNYGGYELRKHYPQRVKKAISVVMITCALISGYTVWANREQEHKIIVPHETVINMQPLDPTPEPEKPKTPELPAAPEPPKEVATASLSNPDIVRNEDVRPEELMASVDELKDKQISWENKTGEPTSTDLGTSISNDTHGNGGGGNGVTESVKAASSEPPTWIEQMPQFNGDLNQYLSNNIHYPDAAREAGIEGRVAVQFVIDEAGNIAEAHVIKSIGGGCDQEALRVVKAMPRWRPGKNNGRPAKVWYTLPVTFRLN